jgi:hypothetical protein
MHEYLSTVHLVAFWFYLFHISYGLVPTLSPLSQAKH